MLVAKEALLPGKGTDEERDQALYEQKMMMVRLLKEKTAIFVEEKTRAKQSDKIFDKNNITMGIVEQVHEIMRQEGRDEELKSAIRKLLTNTEFSPEKIAEIMEIPVTLVKKIKLEMSKK
jgi:hypothetical protein